MVKIETIGMLDVAKINPVLTSANPVKNGDFIVVDGITYLISNTITGDDAYVDGVTIPAGEFLNGYQVDAWAGQKLVIDEKHIAYGDGQSYASITAGTTLLAVDTTNNKVKIIAEAPASGVYFKVTDKTLLTEKAVKAKVIVADNTGDAPITTLAGLTDVDTTGATEGQVLKLNSSGKWAPAADATE